MARENNRFRRAQNLVCYWHADQFVIDNFLSGRRVAAGPLLCDILDFFGTPHTQQELFAAKPGIRPGLLRRAMSRLHQLSFLERDSPRREQAWAEWNPSVGFFHFSTRDVKYLDEDLTDSGPQSRSRVPTVKRYRRATHIRLPFARRDDDFSRVLLRRRTWREFGNKPVRVEDLGTLLGLSFSVQWWVDLGRNGRVPLKTYPSGGACHSLEYYVVVRHVKGLRPGTYHYDAEGHALELLSSGSTRNQLSRYLPAQKWYGSAAALVLITSVFERVQSRYPGARAYRTVLAETGHACQTFCLVATWLGLAPFCSMALADSRIEHDLGLNPMCESVLYAAGVGQRPRPYRQWAPLPPTSRSPIFRRVPVFQRRWTSAGRGSESA